MVIGNTGLKQICMVYWDLRKAEEYWTKVLGIEPEHYYTPVWEEVPSYTDGKADTFRKIEILIYRFQNGVILEINGPGEDDGNPWRRHLERYGEGVMNFAFYVDDLKGAYHQIGQVCENYVPYHEGFYPNSAYTFVDTMPELQVELNIKRDADYTELIKRLEAEPSSYSREHYKM